MVIPAKHMALLELVMIANGKGYSTANNGDITDITYRMGTPSYVC